MRSAKQFEAELMEILNRENMVESITTYKKYGMPYQPNGLVVRLKDHATFNLTIIRSKIGVRSL